MANEDKGRVECPFSGTSAAVRRNSKGRLYFNCPSCGVIQPHGAGFQSWMMDNAELYGPEGRPEAPPPIATPPAAPVEKKPEEKPAKKSALEGWVL